MKAEASWDDYAYFGAIAAAGGLMRAADATGVSAATLSRRMRAFEAALGRRLFQHGAAGYALTADGRALWDKVGRMQGVAGEIAQWRAATTGPVCVRITAGTWTALHLVQCLQDYWQPDADWVPEFVHCDVAMDLARREVDIGIRNTRPDQPWLARRQMGWVEYAAYAAAPEVTGWIGPAYDTGDTPSARWIRAMHGAKIVTKANTPHLTCALAQAGVGRTVLPTFMGDRMPGLVRVSDLIAELRSPQWLVSHQDARHEPPIRAALVALAGVLDPQAG
ncbi:MAG: LysR family transcriptional regulator [Pseudomonadota bacterium]